MAPPSPGPAATPRVRELVEGGFELPDDLGGEHVRSGQRAGVAEGLVSQPSGVEVGHVPGGQLVVCEATRPLRLDREIPAMRSISDQYS